MSEQPGRLADRQTSMTRLLTSARAAQADDLTAEAGPSQPGGHRLDSDRRGSTHSSATQQSRTATRNRRPGSTHQQFVSEREGGLGQRCLVHQGNGSGPVAVAVKKGRDHPAVDDACRRVAGVVGWLLTWCGLADSEASQRLERQSARPQGRQAGRPAGQAGRS